MKTFQTSVAIYVVMLAQPAFAQTPSELAQTSRYIEAFQNPDGGFAAKVGGSSSLGATSSAARILKNTGGSIPDVLAAIKYIKSCFNPEVGGFAATPGGKPDVSTTASGLMAVTEMKIADEAMIKGGIKFLGANAKTFEEVRIAVAGLEAIQKTAPEFARWTEEIQATRNADGTFGQGEGKSRETGGKAVALLRMGVELDKKDAILTYLRSAQRADGAWSRDGKSSELDSTYRIMRLFWMLKEKPDTGKLLAFIASCRHSDGGYGVQPGAEATPGATYFATTVMRWARLLEGEPALIETAGFQPIFNGKDLTGWEGDTSLWSVRDGKIFGSSSGLKHNDFLATESSYDNFILKLTFRVTGVNPNSGIQFRSVRIPGHEMSGFQADIGQNYWGCLYDESRRNKVLVPGGAAAVKTLHKDGWNEYVVDARGDNIRLALNGVDSLRYEETDPAIARAGKLAVQMHAGGPIQVEFKDIYLQRNPEAKADGLKTPGFHLRSLKNDSGEHKHTIFIPEGYDDKKSFPVVLFLHGSGQRGEDGVKSAHLGMGPSILSNPSAFPAIVIFPQAKKTWAADSEDAKAALAILDDVLATFKSDPKRVVLTGLSMGGSGSWSIAAAHPNRFAAVVPISGRGKSEDAKSLASLPLWSLTGDADDDKTVLNMRDMVNAISALGGKPKYTEYRGVGHNSWDRAYHDRALVEWMLAQAQK